MGDVCCDRDVVVVGAGPAGATAGMFLARSGLRVTLIEKAALPRYKTCGGGVVARAFAHLPPGLEIPVEHECSSAEAHFLEGDLHFRVERERPIVSMTMRADLDHALTRAAVEAGAELLSPCELSDLAQGEDGVDLRTSRGTLRAAWVIAADGVLGTTAGKAGWKEAPRTIPALEVELRVPARVWERFAGTARFDLGAMEAGYGWVFPKREHLSCGILTMRRGQANLHEALERYLARIGVTPILSEARHGYLIPVRPRPGGFVRGRVILVGDAAGLADPLTGEGISIAIATGRLAAEALVEAGLESVGTRARYLRSLRRAILPELRISRALAHIVYHRPAFARALFRRRGQALSEAVADVFLGQRTFRSLLTSPSGYLRLLRPDRGPRPAVARSSTPP
jgi:geranylgeranyl reductase family protein